jgi:hypothetical protein
MASIRRPPSASREKHVFEACNSRCFSRVLPRASPGENRGAKVPVHAAIGWADDHGDNRSRRDARCRGVRRGVSDHVIDRVPGRSINGAGHDPAAWYFVCTVEDGAVRDARKQRVPDDAIRPPRGTHSAVHDRGRASLCARGRDARAPHLRLAGTLYAATAVPAAGASACGGLRSAAGHLPRPESRCERRFRGSVGRGDPPGRGRGHRRCAVRGPAGMRLYQWVLIWKPR